MKNNILNHLAESLIFVSISLFFLAVIPSACVGLLVILMLTLGGWGLIIWALLLAIICILVQ